MVHVAALDEALWKVALGDVGGVNPRIQNLKRRRKKKIPEN